MISIHNDSAIGDFLRCSDLARIPEAVVSDYLENPSMPRGGDS